MSDIDPTILAITNLMICTTYLDDVIFCHSTSYERHLSDLNQVLYQLGYRGATINLEKSEFAVNKVTYLGFTIDGNTIAPAEGMINKILALSPPTSVKEV